MFDLEPTVDIILSLYLGFMSNFEIIIRKLISPKFIDDFLEGNESIQK